MDTIPGPPRSLHVKVREHHSLLLHEQLLLQRHLMLVVLLVQLLLLLLEQGQLLGRVPSQHASRCLGCSRGGITRNWGGYSRHGGGRDSVDADKDLRAHARVQAGGRTQKEGAGVVT